MAKKIKKSNKNKSGLNPKQLKNKPVKDILEALQTAELDSASATSFMEELNKEGYPYRGRVNPRDSGLDINFEREVEGYSKQWNNRVKNPEGRRGGYVYKRRYKDGDTDPLTEQEFNEGLKELENRKKKGEKVYYPITEKATPYKEAPELAAGIDLTRRQGQLSGMNLESRDDLSGYDGNINQKLQGNTGTPTLPTDNINADIKSASGKLAPTKTGPTTPPKSSPSGSIPFSDVGNFAGSIVETADPQSDGKSSVAGSSLKMAGQGASAGMMIGGPIGAGVGAAVGAGVGALTASNKNSKIEQQIMEEERRKQKAQINETIQPAKNTQAPIYEDGTIAANISQPVEVEKDEIVLRKNNKGQYYMAADFKKGKTHEQGGEDFQIQEGDIVFPGKKRNTIMRHIRNNNTPGIESERMKLPKDIPNSDELQDGVDNESAYSRANWGVHRSNFLSNIDNDEILKVRQPFIEEKERKLKNAYQKVKQRVENGEITQEEANKLGQEIASNIYSETTENIENAYRENFSGYDALYDKFNMSEFDNAAMRSRTSDLGDSVQFDGLQGNPISTNMGTTTSGSKSKQSNRSTNTPSWLYDPVDTESEIANYPVPRQDNTSQFIEGADPNSDIANYDTSKNIEEQAKESTKVNPLTVAKNKEKDKGQYDIKQEGLNNPMLSNPSIDSNTLATVPKVKSASDVVNTPGTDTDNTQGLSEGALEAMRYLPAATNMVKGLQTPETVDREFYTPEEQQYQDMSEGLRQEANLQRRIESENAARASGGSAQVSRAGKSMAGSRWFKRRQRINEREAQRAQQTEAQNIAGRNQAEMTNIQLGNQYDQMDAQNRAAVDAYFDQGLHDFGRISSQISRDKKMERTQDIALDLIQSPDFRYDKEGNKIKYKG